MAPATRPAIPATMMLLWDALAAATPSTRLAVETMPSLAPNTAARNQPMRSVRCHSGWRTGILGGLVQAGTAGPANPVASVHFGVREVLTDVTVPATSAVPASIAMGVFRGKQTVV